MNRTGWLEEVRSQLAETAAVQQLVAEYCGDAILAAQAAYADSGAFPELLRIYHLLADPGLNLR